ncbi:MAG: integrase core domain-containing protein [Acidimicrobiales bacterium]
MDPDGRDCRLDFRVSQFRLKPLRHEVAVLLGRRHLEVVLAEYVEHYNRHRPHRSLNQRSPSNADAPPTPIGDISPTHLRRTDVLGGLIHEYMVA